MPVTFPSAEKMDAVQAQLRAVCNLKRLKILEALSEKPGTTNVKQIAKKLNIEHSSTCVHLAVLAEAGYVTENKEGREAFYEIDFFKLKRFERISKILR
ncbi:MAG: winged helix-turn-helix transcriptional regulator [Candidatus Pacebacteria bacterium]|nr:winged helix-turn-helix transcriptional regulator [Candidatus Paceibacterota bacterium]